MLVCPQCGREFEAGLTECPYDGVSLRADPTLRAGEPTHPGDAEADEAADPLVGLTLDDKYRLDARLGAGGMGAVYRATHLLIDRPVAVKVLNQKFVEDESARERFRREARAAGRLRHPNAVGVTDFGETREGFVYIVMELLEGRTLRDLIAREAPFDPARAVSLTLQAAAAVAAAHESGVIHRDLKPGNVFVVQQPNAPHRVKVLDFGIAKLAEEEGAEECAPNDLTGAGVMIGTPRYMAPEQCAGEPQLTPAADVYSLGVILYELLTGRTPFEGATPLALALRHASEEPRPPREIVASVPVVLESLVLRALRKDPRERFADAGEFRRELLAAAESLGLEHSAGFAALTPETVRDASVEMSSGRMVVDLERLRRNRAAANPVSASDPTVEEPSAPQTSAPPAPAGRPGDEARPAGADTDAKPAPTGETRPPTFTARAPAAVVPLQTRTRAADRDEDETRVSAKRPAVRPASRSRWTEPPVLVGLICLALLVVFGGLLWWRSPAPVRDGRGAAAPPDASPRTAAPDADAADERVGRTLAPDDTAPRGRAVERPVTAAEFYERGTYKFSVRDYDGAVRDFRRAVELQPDFPSAHNRLGRALLLSGQFGPAAESFRTAVEQRGGDYAVAQYNLGFALQQQGREEEAAEAYRAAIERSGGVYPDAYFQLGDIYDDRPSTLPEAAAAYRKAVEQNGGRDPEALNKLGVVLARSDDLAGAEAAFRQAIEQRGGDFAYAHFNLALVHEKAGRLEEAVGAYETFLTQAPRDENRRTAERSIRELRRRIAAGEGN